MVFQNDLTWSNKPTPNRYVFVLVVISRRTSVRTVIGGPLTMIIIAMKSKYIYYSLGCRLLRRFRRELERVGTWQCPRSPPQHELRLSIRWGSKESDWFDILWGRQHNCSTSGLARPPTRQTQMPQLWLPLVFSRGRGLNFLTHLRIEIFAVVDF